MIKREIYSGLLLLLKKRMKCASSKDKCHFKIFGYYDGLDIHLVEQWYQMRPQGVKDRDGNISLDDDYRDKYILKVYFPEDHEIEMLYDSGTEEQRKMDYDTWRIIGQGMEGNKNPVIREKYKTLCSEFPFLSLVFLNVSKPMAKQINEPLLQVGRCVLDAADNAGIPLREVHGALFPSFGFCDYVLLFLSKNPEEVMTVLDCLKEVRVPGKDFPAISSFYPLTGFEPTGLEKLETLSLENVRISIRINLQEGVSNRQFQDNLEAILPEELKGSQMYHLFGSSDCLLMPDVSFIDCIPLYFGGNIFDPENQSFYQKYICNMRSSIRIASTGSAAEGNVFEEQKSVSEKSCSEGEEDKAKRIEHYTEEFKSLRDKLEQAAKKYRMPIRAVYGIQNVMKSFLDLIRSSHCFDLEAVIGRMFAALSKNVDFNLQIIEMLEGDERANSIQDMWRALNLFREFVGTYLSDMQRSDRSFIEGHTLVHQSIGSSTKLLLFYNRFVSEVSEKLVAQEVDSKEQKYTFLVTSGGTDVTEAFDLFSHLDPTIEECEDIIVLTIPEMSLYDIRGTMFRLLHECLHFCGERKREERYEQVIEAVSAYSATIFCRQVLKHLQDLFEDLVYGNLTHMFSAETLNIVKEKWESEALEVIRETEECLKKFIKDAFIKCMEMNPADYYGRYLYEFVEMAAVQEIFIPVISDRDKIPDESLFYKLYETLQCLRADLAAKLSAILQEEPTKIFFSNARFIESNAREKRKMQKQGEYVIEDMWFINNYIEFYMGKKTEDRYFRIVEADKIVFPELLQRVKCLFKECYADCIAITILGADFTDIIMGIAYETWDIERAFPATSFEKMRRMVEKELLPAERDVVEREMEERIQCWSENGYKSSICWEEGDREKLFERVMGKGDADDSSAYKCLLQPVEDYLRGCISIIEKNLKDFETERKIFQYAGFRDENDLQCFLREMNGSWNKYAEEERC